MMALFKFGINDYTINVDATGQIEFSSGWGVHRLSFIFKVTARDDYVTNAPFSISGDLWASGIPGSERWIGNLASSHLIRLKSFETIANLAVPVTDVQIAEIDRMRAGGDVEMRAFLTLTGLAEDQFPSASNNEVLRIPRATWSKRVAQR
ncbi:hypothetical protein AB0H69_25380 [Streptomyces phaeochromogenes]|uniref:hypothetical protein n=1 Tax=Streptomyces phaeochromogenes TaxID=1923 RepID=UPI003410EE54